jgi:hypothetical protein
MTPTLFLSMGAALLGRPILLAGLPTLPASSLLSTCFTAKMGSPMPRPEQPFASFEQTLPGPMMTALWPFADVPKKMTLVHGRSCSRCSSLGAKRQLRSEAFYPHSPSILLYKTSRIARSTAGALPRSNARFRLVFRALLTTSMAETSSAVFSPQANTAASAGVTRPAEESPSLAAAVSPEHFGQALPDRSAGQDAVWRGLEGRQSDAGRQTTLRSSTTARATQATPRPFPGPVPCWGHPSPCQEGQHRRRLDQ